MSGELPPRQVKVIWDFIIYPLQPYNVWGCTMASADFLLRALGDLKVGAQCCLQCRQFKLFRSGALWPLWNAVGLTCSF